ncbi:hypothetical protein LR48_Vigan11g092600 [Vigna angularis]|uniref:Uncharacterized protein n=1 Tax=Phaseolus angularis TaxID=3914 RepID=A0A0L9VSG2_PHAAN|nr:hypothetical protein LR48_Vigan11g092600 [Vigna angularis]
MSLVAGSIVAFGGEDDIPLYHLSVASSLGSLHQHSTFVTALSFYAPPNLHFPRNLISADDAGSLAIFDANGFVHLTTLSGHCNGGINDLASTTVRHYVFSLINEYGLKQRLLRYAASGSNDSCRSQMTFDIPNVTTLKNNCLSTIAENFRGFKSKLTSRYIFGSQKNKSPCKTYKVIDEETWCLFVQSRTSEEWKEKIRLSEDDPLGALQQLADIIGDKPLEVEYDANVFGRGSEVPIYLHSQDVREVASRTEELNIPLVQLWMMHHWQLLVISVQESYALWFCLLHKSSPKHLRQAIDCSISASMMLVGRSIANNRKLAWIALKGFHFQEWIETQGLSTLVQMKGLKVEGLFSHLRYSETNRWLKKKDVYSNWLRFPGRYTIEILYVQEELNKEEKITAHILGWVILSTRPVQVQDRMIIEDVFMLYAIKNDVPTNWVEVIKDHMIDAGTKHARHLSYAVFISKILTLQGVDGSRNSFGGKERKPLGLGSRERKRKRASIALDGDPGDKNQFNTSIGLVKNTKGWCFKDEENMVQSSGSTPALNEDRTNFIPETNFKRFVVEKLKRLEQKTNALSEKKNKNDSPTEDSSEESSEEDSMEIF